MSSSGIGTATGGQSLSGQINFQGLGSGTDFSSVISKLVQVEQSRVNTYVTWKQSWLDKNTAFMTLNTTMLNLRTTLQGMSSVNSFLQKSATSNNTASVIASATGAADEGNHTFSVKQLAQSKMMVTASGVATLTQNINLLGSAATFNYTYNGVTVSNAIPATATLTDLVNIINTNGDNTGVRASTIFDGTNYYLQIRGLATGSAASLTIDPESTLGGFGGGDFTTVQKNQDSQLKIDGWPVASNAYIARSNNSISDVITGLTLNLQASGAGSVTVATNSSAVLQNVQTFVNQVNQVRSQIIALTKYDSTAKQGSILTGNYGLEMISTIMDNITAATGLGFSTTRDKFSSLAPLGLSTDATEGSPTEGLILLDTNVFSAVLASNANAVGSIFAEINQGETSDANTTFESSIQDITKAGSYPVSYTVANGKITSASINGHAAVFNSNSAYITGAAGQNESGLVLRVNNLTDGAYSSTAYLKEGKIPELVDSLGTLTDPTNGPLNILEANYTDIANDIQTKIDSENVRIAQMQTHLQDQFSKLDALLGTYSQQTSALTSAVNQLSSSSS